MEVMSDMAARCIDDDCETSGIVHTRDHPKLLLAGFKSQKNVYRV